MLTDERGSPVTLGPAIASGGEGTVHPVIGSPALLAKVYKKAPSEQTAEKLRLMTARATPGVRSMAAWPSGLLVQNGSVAGFLMPRLETFEPVQHLYNPAQRLKYFPRAGWRFVVCAAKNCAAAFDEVHKTGCLIGDVNQSNVLVNAQAVARLIDCDSFQVSADGRDYLCEVGVAHYTPPELQGQNFRTVVRTPNHDRFGLAVLMFQFLVVGRHPYAGVFLGRGDLSVEDAVREFRFAYGPNCRARQMDPPPFTPLVTELPTELGTLFGRAFERGSERADARPTALEWVHALGALAAQIRTCTADPGHEYWSGAGRCVWCRIANAKGPDYFFGVGDCPTTFAVDDVRLNGYLARLSAARLLDFPYDRASYEPTTVPVPVDPPENLDAHRTVTAVLAAAAGLGVVLVLLGCFSRFALLTGVLVTLVFGIWLALTVANSPYRRELNRRRSVLQKAWRALEQLEDEWADVREAYRRRYDALARDIQNAARECRQLAQKYQAQRGSLESRREELARAQYLKTCFITDADIPNIGGGRKQTLAAYNVLTAYDVRPEDVLRINGFGPGLTAHLVTWREEMERQFRFDKSKGVPEADLRSLATQYRKQQDALFRDIEQALVELEGLEPRVRNHLSEIVSELRPAIASWEQADEDLHVLRRG